jgi:hypothetical protein
MVTVNVGMQVPVMLTVVGTVGIVIGVIVIGVPAACGAAAPAAVALTVFPIVVMHGNVMVHCIKL